MQYVLAAIAGVWMADGLALLVAPQYMISRMRDMLALSPSMLRWEALAACLGVILLIGAEGLRYQPLWIFTGIAMLIKSLFLVVGPMRWRQELLDWCLQRDDVDYRFWGLGLCTLALLLLHTLGWLGAFEQVLASVSTAGPSVPERPRLPRARSLRLGRCIVTLIGPSSPATTKAS